MKPDSSPIEQILFLPPNDIYLKIVLLYHKYIKIYLYYYWQGIELIEYCRSTPKYTSTNSLNVYSLALNKFQIYYGMMSKYK